MVSPGPTEGLYANSKWMSGYGVMSQIRRSGQTDASKILQPREKESRQQKGLAKMSGSGEGVGRWMRTWGERGQLEDARTEAVAEGGRRKVRRRGRGEGRRLLCAKVPGYQKQGIEEKWG